MSEARPIRGGPNYASLPDLTQGATWRISLPHQREEHLLFWLSRGEGRALLGGRRVGLSQDTVCVIPAGAVSMIETSTRASGHGLLIPAAVGGADFGPARAVRSTGDAVPRLDAGVTLEEVAGWLAAHPAAQIPASKGSEALRRALFERLALPRPAAQSMASHAAALGVSPTHLTRVCSAALGRTAAELITGRTLHAARVALEDTSVPIKEIADQIGFSSAAYFTRFVQKHTGLTPSALRRAAASAAPA